MKNIFIRYQYRGKEYFIAVRRVPTPFLHDQASLVLLFALPLIFIHDCFGFVSRIQLCFRKCTQGIWHR